MPAVLRGRLFIFAAGTAALLLLVSLVVASARGIGGDEAEDGPALAEAPAFSLPTFDGKTFALDDHAGGPVLLYFWASWCEPCKAEASTIQSLWEEYRGHGFTFVGVNIWDSEKEARAFVERYGLTFPTVRDDRGKVYLDYGVERLPLAMFMRPGLEVDRRFIGQLEEDELRRMLGRLAEPA